MHVTGPAYSNVVVPVETPSVAHGQFGLAADFAWTCPVAAVQRAFQASASGDGGT